MRCCTRLTSQHVNRANKGGSRLILRNEGNVPNFILKKLNQLVALKIFTGVLYYAIFKF